MTNCVRWLRVMLLVWGLAACGGGGGDSAPPAAPAPASIPESIEVGPQAALLTQVGERRQLAAVVRDTSGQTMQAALDWSSSDASVVSVDGDGLLRADVAAGSAWITARSGNVASTPVLVTIAQPVAGAQLLADNQIVSGPTPVDPNAVPAAGNPYEVLLRGVPTLAVGSLVIASESANVAGRVLSVQAEASGDQRVRLVAVPPTQLFTDFAFRETVDLGSAVFGIPPDIAARYDVVQNGATYVFTPRPGITHQRERPTAATGTSALPPVPPFGECEVSPDLGLGIPLPLALSAPPAFEVTVDGSVQREATSAGMRTTLSGGPKFKLSSAIEIRAAFEAKIGCKATLLTRKLRVPGWAGLFFGGDVEFGVGFELGGKVTIASAKLGAEVKLDTTLSAVLDCPAAPAHCSLTGSASAEPAFEPQFTAPALAQAQFEPALNLFGFVSLEAGNADIEQLQFKAIELKAGAELSAALTAEALQIANLDGDTGRSKYALAFKGEVGPGVGLGEFLAFLGLNEGVPLKLAFSVDLGGSPKAASVVADRARFLPGERANVVVKLDAASTRFPLGLLYNVERVELRRNSGLVGTEVLAQLNASEGQTDFELAFDAPGLIDVGEIFAFVFTKALPFLPVSFELAAAQCVSGCGADVTVSVQPGDVALTPGATRQFTASVVGSAEVGVAWAATGGTITAAGLFTAGATPGNNFRVRATSIADPNAFADATVTIISGAAVGVTRVTSRGLVSSSLTNVGEADGGCQSIESPIGAVAWSDSSSCIGAQAEQGTSASGTASFAESYVGNDLVAVTSSGSATASAETSGSGTQGIGLAQYTLQFRLAQATTVTIDAAVNTAGGFSLSGPGIDLRSSTGVSQSVRLGPGTYSLAMNAGAHASTFTAASKSAEFSMTLSFGP
jgi:hypothetical protein